MKWKIIPCINCVLLLLLSSCKNSNKNELNNIVVKAIPVSRQLNAVETAAQKALADIEKQEIELSGDKVVNIDIEGMEVIWFSKKEYLTDELKSQEESFKRYLYYLDHVSMNKKINDPLKRQESQAKHNAVIAYLKEKINMASNKKEVYKVIYYERLQTKNRNYTQPKITYLDSSMKKITSDYGFLKERL